MYEVNVENKEYNIEKMRAEAQLKAQIRLSVDNLYDIQSLRVATGNRICMFYYRRLENEVSKEEMQQLLNGIMVNVIRDYELITAVANEKFADKPRSSTKLAINASIDSLKFVKEVTEYKLVKQYIGLREKEKEAVTLLEDVVKQHPMYDLFFKDVKGCGPAISGMCLAYLDIHTARHVSYFWAYAGVGTRVNPNMPDIPEHKRFDEYEASELASIEREDPDEYNRILSGYYHSDEYVADFTFNNRVAMSRRNLIDVTYTTKDGSTATRKSIGYNERLHTKLLGSFGDQMVMRKGTKYREVYDCYKDRYANRPDWRLENGEVNKIRCHRAAIRQGVKALLRDLWVIWREYEGYSISEPYEVEYLHRAPHKYNEAHYVAALKEMDDK